MDVIQDWAQYAYHHGAPMLLYLNPYASQFYHLYTSAQSWLMPVVNQAINKPDLTTIVLLLVILFLSLKLLNVMWQAVMFWLRMFKRIAFWGGLTAIGLWFWTRGPDGVTEDIQYWMEVWNNEHKYWQDRERAAKRSKLQAPYGKAQRVWF